MEILSGWNPPFDYPLEAWAGRLSNPPAELAAFLPPGPDTFAETYRRRTEYIAQHIRRGALAEALDDWAVRLGAPQSSRDAIAALGEDNAYLVIAGQQPGLLTGPLLTLYKTIHAIHLARELTERHGARFFPAFWNASEDHDHSEADTLWWLTKDNRLESFRWELPEDNSAYFAIGAEGFPFEALTAFIRERSHPTEFMDEALETIREAAEGAETLPDIFDRLLWKMFPDDGLIIIRPDRPEFRRLAAPVIEAELGDPAAASAEVTRAGETLKAGGIAGGLHKRADRAPFFLIEDGKRLAPRFEDGEFRVPGGKPWSAEELRERLRNDPGAFSPSAVLRPVVQDAVLPTAAAVLGPGELLYHSQLGGVYERHGVPRPCAVPRCGATLVEPRVIKWMDKQGLDPGELGEDARALLKKRSLAARPDALDRLGREAREALDRWFEALKDHAAGVDPSIGKALDKNRGKALGELENAENLVARREAAMDENAQKQIAAAQTALFPGGGWQERRLNIFQFIVKYGPAVTGQLKDALRGAGPGQHCFIKIE